MSQLTKAHYDSTDRYMYARAGHSTLLTVIYDHNTTHCLQYRRHMRSPTVGRFVLFYQHTSLISAPPSHVTLTNTKILSDVVSGNPMDIWLVLVIDILLSYTVQCIALCRIIERCRHFIRTYCRRCD